MGCNCNCQECNDQEPCTSSTCSCPITDFPTACILYTGPDLECVDIVNEVTLEDVIVALDQLICDRIAYVITLTTLVNLGNGAKVYKPNILSNNKQIRTIVSEDTTHLDVIENEDTVGIRGGVHNLTKTDDIISLIVSTLSGDTTLSNIDLSEYNSLDTFVQSASFDSGTLDLTITRNNGESDIVIPLDFLSNFVESGTYSSDTITLTLTDASTVDIDLSTLVTEILGAVVIPPQVKSDYLELTPSSDAFIQNKNPSKTVVLGAGGNYNLVDSDNNYIIEIDNGVNDVTITTSGVTATTEFFVGFVQKGTGEITFVGYDVNPIGLGAKIIGQGHVCSLEVINSTQYLFGNLKA
jgi:hypothetical protein